MNAGVNIVYPIKGKSYPVTDPAVAKIKSAYITASFSTTCGDVFTVTSSPQPACNYSQQDTMNSAD